MGLAPETGVSPTAQAPPDRPTLSLEQWARQGLALLFADRQLDVNEQRILAAFFHEVQARAQALGGIGVGAQPPQGPGGPEGAPQSPMDMNATGAEPLGTDAGAQPIFPEEM